MIWTTLRQVIPSMFLLPSLVIGAGLVAGCGVLDVSDPTLVEADDLDNGTSADLIRKAALNRLAVAMNHGVLSSGLLADEFFADPGPSFTQGGSMWDDEALDRRESRQAEELTSEPSPYNRWKAVRMETSVAIPRLQEYMPEPARDAYVGQMFAVRGFATLHLAEDYCPGVPLHTLVDLEVVYGPQHTTEEMFENALADFDSAVVYAVDTARFLNFARVGRARTLLGLGRFAEAADAAAAVPTAYVWNVEYSNTIFMRHSLMFQRTSSNSRQSVADREGGTGLDYVTADDPRVETPLLGLAYDGMTELRAIGKYPARDTPILLASGIEARLIEAEAALQANPDDLSWLAILNDLRAATGNPELTPLADPGTDVARVDLLFRERAFWLFATGHRLGDMRRLIQHYGRDPETVFPSGAYRLGGLYGTGTSIPFPAEEEAAHNPAVTGCTSR